MTQSTKRPSGRKPAGKTPSPVTEDQGKKSRRTGIIAGVLIFAVVLIAAGIGYYWFGVKPFQTKVIIVGEDSINIDYFVKRLRMDATAEGDPNIMLERLTHEILIRQGAPRYGIEATEDDIDDALREMARGESEAISDIEFKEWYRQQLNETKLSDTEYRELTYTFVLARELHEYLAERVPTVAEQVHLHIIVFETYEDAVEVKEQLEAGADFAELAREVSIDEASGENGGDVGWVPVGILEGPFQWTAANSDIGEISDPLRTGETAFSLVMISEKAVAREMDEVSLEIMKAKVLEDWLVEEMGYKKIEFHGFNNGFDSYTYQWIMLELAKRARQAQ